MRIRKKKWNFATMTSTIWTFFTSLKSFSSITSTVRTIMCITTLGTSLTSVPLITRWKSFPSSGLRNGLLWMKLRRIHYCILSPILAFKKMFWKAWPFATFIGRHGAFLWPTIPLKENSAPYNMDWQELNFIGTIKISSTDCFLKMRPKIDFYFLSI